MKSSKHRISESLYISLYLEPNRPPPPPPVFYTRVMQFTEMTPMMGKNAEISEKLKNLIPVNKEEFNT